MSRLDRIQRQEIQKARCASARANLHKPQGLTDEMWEQAFGGGEGYSIKDGWARIFALSKLGRLYMFARVRFADEWMGASSPHTQEIEEMTKWPLATMKKQNPFRQTFFTRTVVSAPIFDKVNQQYKVVFDCKPTVTFWFKEDMMKAPGLDGWLMPRRQRQTFPWDSEGGVKLRQPKPPRMWVPDLSVEEMNMLLDGKKAQVICLLHKRHAENLKNREICVMDIKESIDAMLDSLK